MAIAGVVAYVLLNNNYEQPQYHPGGPYYYLSSNDLHMYRVPINAPLSFSDELSVEEVVELITKNTRYRYYETYFDDIGYVTEVTEHSSDGVKFTETYKYNDVGVVSISRLQYGRPFETIGQASDAKAGAVILTENDQVMHIDGLETWPKELLGKILTINGTLELLAYVPSSQTSDEGLVSQGVGIDEKQLVLKNAEWEISNTKESNSITKKRAISITEVQLATEGQSGEYQHTYAIYTDRITENEYAWQIPFDTVEAVETGNWSASVPGIIPYVVDKSNGDIYAIGNSSVSIDRLEEFRKFKEGEPTEMTSADKI